MAPKKKLTKKEKARIEAEKAEILRIEMEKEKLRKFEEERERKLREREEAEKRQQQEIAENKIRRAQLKISMEYFDNVRSIIEALNIDKKESIDWEQYMRCNGLPDGHNPGDIRKYIHTWIIDIKKRNASERNWLLKTDERTLLNQDQDAFDLSQKTLKKQQENLGDIYSQRIREILGILIEMKESLNDGKLSESTIIDLRRLKLDIRMLLQDYLDDFTCRILTQIDRDMEILKLGISTHEYTSDVFKSQILTIQDVSTTKEVKIRSDEPQTNEIEFPLLEIQVDLPPTIEIKNSAIRGLWLNYDHFSDSCASFLMPKIKTNKLNILQQTKKEWKKRKEIILATLEDTTRIVPLELNFDPTESQETSVIDVDKVYSEYEDELNKIRRRAMGVDVLNLSEFEVNLRKYRIVGGVYSIDHLEQPQQVKRINEKTFIRTIISPDKIIPKKFHESYKPPPPPLPGVRRLPEEVEAEMRMIEKNLDKLAMVTIQLPETVLWLEPPITCRWETSEEFEKSENEEITIVPSLVSSTTNASNEPSAVTSQQSAAPQKTRSSIAPLPTTKKLSTTEMKRKYSRKQSKKSMAGGSLSLNGLPLKEVIDFDLSNIPPKLDLYGLTVDFLVPRLPDGYCIKMEKSLSYNKSANRHLYLARYEEKTEETQRRDDAKKAEIKEQRSRSINESMFLTNSPRPLFPVSEFNKVLKIKSNNFFYDDKVSTDPDEISVEDKTYMFSQLLEDLDDLCDLNVPYFDHKPDDLSSKLTSPNNSLPPTPPRKFSTIFIMRDTDVDATAKKNETNEMDDQSLSEYDDDNDNDNESEQISDEETNENQIRNQQGRWSTRDVHDSKFNEDKFSVQFRTGRLGFFGFAINRYSNMPYQTWEIKPDLKSPGLINFNLTAAVVSIEISVTEEGYCVNSFQGGTIDAINEMIGKTLPLVTMKQILQNSGIDIFPETDAFCYTEGSCEKNYVMETHLYRCMSSLALSHNFSWSRWNLLSGSRVAITLMRELIDANKKSPNHSTLYVTPLKAAIVDCTEVSASFTTVPAPGIEYYADLHQLTSVHAHPISKKRQSTLDPVLRENVAQILMSTRPLSFC